MPLPFANEDEFQQWIVVTARNHGWRTFWVPNWMYRLAMASMKRSRRHREWPDKGLPDLILLRGQPNPQLLIWEVKDEKGRATPEQKGWLADFAACGIETRIVKPRDRDYIEERLAA